MLKSQYLIISFLFLLFFSGCSNSNVSLGPGQTDDLGNLKVLSRDYLTQVGLGNVPGASVIHKFGSSTIDTTPHIISASEMFMTPTVPQSLEFVSSDAGDTYLGVGARQITISFINSTWERDEMIINTSGLTPVQLPEQVLRIDRWFVSSSGTYASPGTTSYTGDLTIRETGGGAIWTNIFYDPITTGQSQIGVATIPKGKKGYLISKCIFSDSTKSSDIYFFQRENADDITAPFNGTRRIIEREVGVSGGFCITFAIPKGPIVGPADIGFFGTVDVATAEASVEFELLLIDSD